MKEEKLNRWFESIRLENSEISADEVAGWLNLPSPVFSPSVTTETEKKSMVISKKIIVMSFIITIISTLLLFPGNHTETPSLPEMAVDYHIETPLVPEIVPESRHITESLAEYPVSKEHIPPLVMKESISKEDLTENPVVGFTAPFLLRTKEYSVVTPAKNHIHLPKIFDTSMILDQRQNIPVDTLFTDVKTIVVKCTSCEIVKFRSHPKDEVHFKGEILLQGNAKLNRKAIPEFVFERKGSALMVSFKPADKRKRSKKIKQAAKILFEIPDDVDIRSEMIYGDIEIDHIRNGFCTIATASGNISIKNSSSIFNISAMYGKQYLHNIAGPMTILTASGDIQMDRIRGNVDLSNTYGKVNISHMEGSLHISGKSSHININSMIGDMDVKTTYGNINIAKAAGKLSASATSGNISIEQLKGTLHTESTYGNMSFSDVSGSVFATGRSTNFTITSTHGDISIKNTYGNVLLKATSGNINIVNSSGNVEGYDVFLTERMQVALTYGNMKMKLNNEFPDLTYDLTTQTGKLRIKQLSTEGKKKISQGNGPVKVSVSTSSGDLYFE